MLVNGFDIRHSLQKSGPLYKTVSVVVAIELVVVFVDAAAAMLLLLS